MKTEVFYNLSDNADLSNLTLESLDAIKEHILNDIPNYNSDEIEDIVYTISPVLMTREEFDNLPEYQF